MKKTPFTIVLLLLGALNNTAARGATLSHLTDKLAVVPQPSSTAHVTMKVGSVVWDVGELQSSDVNRAIAASLSQNNWSILAGYTQPSSTAHVTMKVGSVVWDVGQVSVGDVNHVYNASLSQSNLATLAGYTQPSITETLDAGSLLATTTWSPQNTYAGGVTGLGFRLEAFLWDTTSHNGYLAGTFFTSVSVPEPVSETLVLILVAWVGIWYFGRKDGT